jgi:hypothetical protein
MYAALAQGRIPWDPDTLRRAVRDIKAERAGSAAGSAAAAAAGGSSSRAGSGGGVSDSDDDDERVTVLDCEDFKRTELTQHEFFKG